MTLDKLDPITVFKILQPRWHDKKVLLNKPRVDKSKTDHLKVTFETNSLQGDWYISRKVAKRAKVESNGVIDCYCIPLDKLEPLTISERSAYIW